MRFSAVGFAGASALVALGGCDCRGPVTVSVLPQIRIDLTELDFGPTLVGGSADKDVLLRAETKSSVTISAVNLVGDDKDAFSIVAAPSVIPGNGATSVSIRFSPTQKRAYQATAQVHSDDPDDADKVKSVLLLGEGALPEIRLLPACNAPCANRTVAVTPPSIDYGEEPASRVIEPKTNEWPSITILNDGRITLAVTGIRIEGDDPDRFAPTSSTTIDPTSPQQIEPGSGLLLYLKFAPCGFDAQGARKPCPASPKSPVKGVFVVLSSDPNRPRAEVALTGKLKPNTAPDVCASIVKMLPAGEAERSIPWQQPVTISPATQVTLSAYSDYHRTPCPAGTPAPCPDLDSLTLCTTDAEDGRKVLKYAWSVQAKPAESRAVVIGSANAGTRLQPVAYRPDATGTYTLRLTVTDPQGAAGSADVTFEVVPQKDIAVQLAWTEANTDLDLHLVKPGVSDCPPTGTGVACAPFDTCCDVSAFANVQLRGAVDKGPDWGNDGDVLDDPRSEFDATGNTTEGSVENVNVNYPHNDGACATARCTYKVYVHYFRDDRTFTPAPPACSGTTCKEGGACNCGSTLVPDGLCVSRQCRPPPKGTLKVFVQSQRTAALEIPLPTQPTDVVVFPGPCFLWHAADIEWPSAQEVAQAASDGGTAPAPTVTAVKDVALKRVYLYYGQLPNGSQSCTPNTTPPETWFLPGTPPGYP